VVSVTDLNANPTRINHIVEKPAREDAPSNLAVIGRSILEPEIIEILENTGKGSGGEIQLTDAIEALAQQQDVYAYRFKGIRYDCGSKLGFLKANVEYALNHTELGEEFREYLKGLSCRKSR
jgi:UTP--glucose-1-phosphate uridylyltransferase